MHGTILYLLDKYVKISYLWLFIKYLLRLIISSR